MFFSNLFLSNIKTNLILSFCFWDHCFPATPIVLSPASGPCGSSFESDHSNRNSTGTFNATPAAAWHEPQALDWSDVLNGMSYFVVGDSLKQSGTLHMEVGSVDSLEVYYPLIAGVAALWLTVPLESTGEYSRDTWKYRRALWKCSRLFIMWFLKNDRICRSKLIAKL